MFKKFFLKIWHTLFDYSPTPEEQAAKDGTPYDPADPKNLADPNNPGSTLNQTQRLL